MPRFQMDDGFDSELRVFQAGTAAFGLYSRAGIWVSRKLTDGVVPTEIATQYGTREWIERLTGSGLWMPVSGGFLMPDYLDPKVHANRTRAQVEADRAAKAERDRRHYARKTGRSGTPVRRVERRNDGTSNDAPNDGSNDAAPSPPTPKGVGMGVPGSSPSTAADASGVREPADAGSAAPAEEPGTPIQDQTPATLADPAHPTRQAVHAALAAGQQAFRASQQRQPPPMTPPRKG